MTFTLVVPSALVITLCVASGSADAQGFVHASRIWRGDQLVWGELWRSAAGFLIGIGSFWISVRFMNRLGIVTPEVQTMIWFVVTIVGVAITSGRFARWPLPDQLLAGAITLALGWLLVRTA